MRPIAAARASSHQLSVGRTRMPECLRSSPSLSPNEIKELGLCFLSLALAAILGILTVGLVALHPASGEPKPATNTELAEALWRG
jgi:hypothetical protein